MNLSVGERTAVEFALIGNHEHDFPLEYIAVYQSTANPRDILVGLHLLQLTGQHSPSRCRCHICEPRVVVADGRIITIVVIL